MRHTSRPLPRLKTLACTALLALLAACSTVDRGKPPALESAATWAVLPFANHTETPLAGNRAEARCDLALYREPQILGTGGALVNARAFLDQDDAFFLHNGDVLTDLDLAALAAAHRAGGALATLALVSTFLFR